MNIIHLTLFQLINLGVHLGHHKKYKKFLSSWIFGGWRENIFLMNMIKTIQMFKYALKSIFVCAVARRPIWFINVHDKFSGYISRYGYICGECYYSYWWVAGNLTNFKLIIGWHEFLLKLLLKDDYKLRHSDKKLLSSYIGLLGNRRRLPAIGIIPQALGHYNILEEFAICKFPTISIVDSNIISSSITIPIPGNDDSMLCLNFYSYLFSRNIITAKISIIKKWKKNLIISQDKVKLRKKVLNLLLFSNNRNKTIKHKFITMPIFSSVIYQPSSSFSTLAVDEKIVYDPIKKLLYSFWARDAMFPLVGVENDIKNY